MPTICFITQIVGINAGESEWFRGQVRIEKSYSREWSSLLVCKDEAVK